MSEKKVGIRFNLKGADSAPAKFRAMGGAFGKSVREIERDTKSFSRVWGGFRADLDATAKFAKTALVGIGAGLTAFGTMAVAIPYKLAKSRTELAGAQSHLRALGMDEASISVIENRFRDVQNRFAGMTTAGLTEGAYNIKSAWNELNAAQVAGITEFSALGARTTKMSGLEEATQYLAKLKSTLKPFYKDLSPQDFTKMVWAQTRGTVEGFATTGGELARAAQNSASVLAQSGWKLRHMLGTWGMLSESMGGAEAGTALEDIALNVTKGFGLIGAAVDEGAQRFIQKLGKPGKELVLKTYGRMGRELFGEDPAKFFELLNVAKNKLVAAGEDWKPVFKEAFGEGPMKALSALMSRAGELSGVYSSTAKRNFSEVEQRAVSMNRGIKSSIDLLSQRWTGFLQTLGKTSAGPVGAAMDAIGNKLVQASTLWSALFTDENPIERIVRLRKVGGQDLIETYRSLKGVRENFDNFQRGFGAAFSKSFTALDELTPKLSTTVSLLGQADPTKWERIGKSWGDIAGKDFSDAITLLRLMVKLAGFTGRVAQGSLDFYTGRFFKEKAIPGLQDAGGGFQQWLQNTFPAVFGAVTGKVPQKERGTLVLPVPATSRAPGAATAPSPLSSIIPPGTNQAPVINVAPPNVNLQPSFDVNVKVGRTELEALAVEAVERHKQFTADRLGYGYGDRID